MSFMTCLTDAFYTFTILPYIANHKYRTKKYGESVNEKFGMVPRRAGENKCLLLHAVSVGEVIAAKTVIDEFEKRHPDWAVRISVSTATGRDVAIKRYGQERVCFYPLDMSRWVNRFFDQIRPDVIILMELEVWPNFLELAAERKIPVIVANGRITGKSAQQYKKFGFVPIVKKMLNAPSLWLAQSEEYATRLREIGVNADKIHVTGSVKYDTINTDSNQQTREKYRLLIGADEKTKVIVAGSTHPSEEETVLAAFKQISAEFPGSKLVLVPRHPHRLDEVENLTGGIGNCIRRSKIENSASADIILVDTMGELSSLYTAADAVFIGGTFIDHGGQNMMEPCGFGIPTVIGPSTYNFSEAVEILLAAEGIIKIDGRDELYPRLKEIIANPVPANEMAARGKEALLKQKGASAKTIDFFEEVIEKNAI